MVRVALGSCPGEQPDSRGDGEDARHLPAAHRLSEHAHAEAEQDDQADREGRFDERQGDEQQGADLSSPAGGGQGGAEQPERAPHKPREQGRTQRMLAWHLPGFERLQRDGARVEHRGRERCYKTGEDVH